MTFQNDYPLNMPIGVPGRIADCGFKNTLSPQCLEAIPPAVGVMKPANVDYKIMLPRNNVGTVTLSADLILANVVNATVNGIAIAPVTFNSTHLATMQAVAAAIKAIPTVESVTVGGANNRALTIISKTGTSTAITVFTVTLGASQATVTIATSQSGTFFGVTQTIYNKMSNWSPSTLASNIGAPYLEGEVAPTLTQGRIYVVPEDIVTSNSAVYIRIAASGLNTQLGAFRSDADAGSAVLIPATAAIWREGNGSVGGIAVLELNIP